MKTIDASSKTLDYQKLYKDCFAPIAHYVNTHGGTQDEAKDIFQEGVVVLWQKEQQGLELTASEKTFLFAICKNLWLKKIRQKKRFVSLDRLDPIEKPAEPDIAASERNTVITKLKGLFQRITAHCYQMIQDLFYRGKDIQEIQMEYGYTTRKNAINQKYKCMKQLKKASQQKK